MSFSAYVPVDGGNTDPSVVVNFTPSTGTEASQLPPATASHHYVEFVNRHKEFVALVDSAAQMNVVSESVLSQLSFSKTIGPCPYLRWGDSSACRIVKWILMPVLLQNGENVVIRAAVVRGISKTIILGRPFLIQTKAVEDHAAEVLTTPSGSVPLLVGYQVPGDDQNFPIDAASDTSDDEVNDESELSEEEKKFKEKTSCSQCSPQQRLRLRKLLRQHSKLWRGEKIGAATGTQHVICPNVKRPIVLRPRRHTEKEAIEIIEEMERMIKDGIIRQSNSPYAMELVLVLKPNGKWRVCVDFRALNKVTTPDKYPLPRVDDLLKAVKGSKYFIALDQRWGYWQIPLEKESCKFTAFRCPLGLFEFVVMPFGLVNAPATFQRYMDDKFGDLRFKGVLVYLDDILIHGNSVDEVLDSLEEVLKRLKEAGLNLNLEKCDFFPVCLKYLGHIFEGGMMFPNPKKIETLQRIKRPSTVHEVRSLLGMFNYYKDFVPHLSTLTAPINDLLSGIGKGKKDPSIVDWCEVQDLALELLKKSLINAVLAIPLDSDEFLMETDASDYAVAAVLNVQRDGKWVPVQFTSKKLSGPQLRWPVREKEAFAIIHGLQKFDYLLRGREFTVHTDHQSLQWILDARVGKLARWACLLADYKMKVFWKKGSSLVHIDYFSRFIEEPDPVLDYMVYQISTGVSVSLPTIEEVVAAQKNCDLQPSVRLTNRDGVWYYLGRIWVPEAMRSRVIASCHIMSPLQHPRVTKTSKLITRAFNWPYLHQDVVRFVQSCLTCQRLGSGRDHLQGLFRCHPVSGPFHKVYMDFWSATYAGKQESVLTMIDNMTKWVEVISVPNHKKETVASAFVSSWVSRFGVPRVLVADGEGAFISDLLRLTTKKLGGIPLSTTPYHPEGNSPIESFHRYLRRGLTEFNSFRADHLPFNEALQLVAFAYRCTPHSTLGDSPAFLTYGVDLLPPSGADWRFARTSGEQDRINFLNLLRMDIQFQAYRKRVKDNIRVNQKRLDVRFQLNDLILCRQQPRKEKHVLYPSGDKLSPTWSLPFRVVKVMSGGKAALVHSLLSKEVRNVHIQNVRFVQKPTCQQMQDVWENHLANEDSVFNPATRHKVLQQFWEQVHFPQDLEVEESPKPRKRPRGSKKLGGAVDMKPD